ncbi:MAG TPA: hypothetical protein VIM19_04015 [Actinomycetes bacterium]
MARPGLLHLRFDVRGSLLDAALECEAAVFLQWYGNTRAQLDDEYGPYADHSTFLALADDDGQVIAACRLITPGPLGLKTLADIGADPWNVDGERAAAAAGLQPATTWDIATVGVRTGLGAEGMLASVALYHGLVKVQRVNRVRHAVSIMDDKVKGLMDALGVYMHPIPGTRSAPYLGSPASTPVYGDCAKMVDGQRRANPDAYRLVGLGIGLDGIEVPGDDAFRLRERDLVIQLPGLPVRAQATPGRSGSDA